MAHDFPFFQVENIAIFPNLRTSYQLWQEVKDNTWEAPDVVGVSGFLMFLGGTYTPKVPHPIRK